MASLRMSAAFDTRATLVPNAFIDYYMPAAPFAAYSLVYITAYRMLSLGQAGEAGASGVIAGRLRLLESEVRDAWRYWAGVGLARIGEDETGAFSVELLPVPDRPEEPSAPAPKRKLYVAPAAQPSYTPEEISICMDRSEEARALFKDAERVFGRPLTTSEMGMLMSFMEWYALPTEVIAELLGYCAERAKSEGNPSKLRRPYLESLARDWSDSEIKTAAAAREHVAASDPEPVSHTAGKPRKKKRAFNFEQRQTYDFDAIEREDMKLLIEGGC